MLNRAIVPATQHRDKAPTGTLPVLQQLQTFPQDDFFLLEDSFYRTALPEKNSIRLPLSVRPKDHNRAANAARKTTSGRTRLNFKFE